MIAKLVSFLTILLVSLAILGSDCREYRFDEIDEGAYSEPEILPWALVASPDEDPFLQDLGEEASAWWNDELSRDGNTRVAFVFEGDDTPYLDETIGVIWLQAGFTGKEALGLFEFAERDERLQWGEITVSSDILYDEETSFWVLVHEMGHALGLADDRHSLDFPSVMASPLIRRGELFETDFQRVVSLFQLEP